MIGPMATVAIFELARLNVGLSGAWLVCALLLGRTYAGRAAPAVAPLGVAPEVARA